MAKTNAKKISRDIPLSELTLRKYEKPYKVSRRELVKKLCLSLGLLQPGDSRDVVVDIFCVLLEAKKAKRDLDSETIRSLVIEHRQKSGLENEGTASSNIRRQLRRMRELFFVDKIKNHYKISEHGSLLHIFEDKIERFLLASTVDRIKEYLQEVDYNE